MPDRDNGMIPLPAFQQALNGDPEFRLQARYLDATLRFMIGESQSFLVHLRQGEARIDPLVTPFDGYDIQFAGTEEHWRELLAETPKAFYQDAFPAMLYHGFRIEGDMATIMAYYPAMRRLQDVMRAVVNTGVPE